MRLGTGLIHVSAVLGLVAGLLLGAQEAAAARGQAGAWGNSNHGQLGDGAQVNRYKPVRVKGSHGAEAIAIDAGDQHSLALAADGTVWAWGNDYWGQLGDGTTGDPSCFCRTTAVRVHGLSGVTAISAGGADGDEHSLALKSDGTVWAWGYDYSGQLGDGTQGGDSSCACRTAPVQTLNLSGVTALSAGGYHSLALLSDGTVWAWGWDQFGQLGDGTTGDPSCSCRLTPVQTQRLVDVTAISAGGAHSLALRVGT